MLTIVIIFIGFIKSRINLVWSVQIPRTDTTTNVFALLNNGAYQQKEILMKDVQVTFQDY